MQTPTLKFNNCVLLLRQIFMSFSFRAYFTNCLRLKEKFVGSFLVREQSRGACIVTDMLQIIMKIVNLRFTLYVLISS